MAAKLDTLTAVLQAELGELIESSSAALGELTVEVSPTNLMRAMRRLRDHPQLKFESMVDLCGADYSAFGDGEMDRPRYAAIYHLLSFTHNWRLRVRTFAADDEFPVIDSLIDVWPGLDWYEREAFDLFGIVFTGHPDLRRLLTDYGFAGHPFRKDFPLSGNVEVRYDPEQKRVIYQPVSIEPREIVPRIIRENAYGESE